MAARGAEKEQLYREMVGGRMRRSWCPDCAAFSIAMPGRPWPWPATPNRENVRFVLDRARLGGYFRVVLDGHQVSRPKPDPEIYLRAAELLGVAAAKLHGFRGLAFGGSGRPGGRNEGNWSLYYL